MRQGEARQGETQQPLMAWDPVSDTPNFGANTTAPGETAWQPKAPKLKWNLTLREWMRW